MTHIWMSHVTYVNAPCHLHRNSVSWMSHGIHIKESWHISMGHVTCTNASWHIWDWVLSRMKILIAFEAHRFACILFLCYGWVMAYTQTTHLYVSQNSSFLCVMADIALWVIWLTSDMTKLHICYISNMTNTWHDSYMTRMDCICVINDMTHTWHDSPRRLCTVITKLHML